MGPTAYIYCNLTHQILISLAIARSKLPKGKKGEGNINSNNNTKQIVKRKQTTNKCLMEYKFCYSASTSLLTGKKIKKKTGTRNGIILC